MTMEIFNGKPPAEAEILMAPVIERWMLLSNDNGTHDASGFVSGHHSIPDGEFAVTSALLQIDPSTPPRWVRSKNRVYRLDSPAGAVESQVRELARECGVRPQQWDGIAYIKIIERLSGQDEADLDIIEQLIAILLRHGHITVKAATILLTTYRKERAAC